MSNAFWELLAKEVRSSKLILLVSVSAIAAWDVFLATRVGKWQWELIAGMAWMPLGMLHFYALLAGVASFSHEWRGNHTHLVLSLPVRGWQVFGTKTLCTLCEVAVITIVTALGATLLGAGPMRLLLRTGVGIQSAAHARVVYKLAAIGIGLLWLSAAVVAIIAQFSYVAGRMFQRFGGSVMVWTLLLSFWGLLRFTSVAAPAFRWLPDLPFQVWNNVNGLVRSATVRLDSAPFVAATLWLVLLFGMGSWLLERHIEV